MRRRPFPQIAAVLDAWVCAELAPYYSSTGRPLIDPELMIRMLTIGCVFAIRSEPALGHVQVTSPIVGFTSAPVANVGSGRPVSRRQFCSEYIHRSLSKDS